MGDFLSQQRHHSAPSGWPAHYPAHRYEDFNNQTVSLSSPSGKSWLYLPGSPPDHDRMVWPGLWPDAHASSRSSDRGPSRAASTEKSWHCQSLSFWVNGFMIRRTFTGMDLVRVRRLILSLDSLYSPIEELGLTMSSLGTYTIGMCLQRLCFHMCLFKKEEGFMVNFPLFIEYIQGKVCWNGGDCPCLIIKRACTTMRNAWFHLLQISIWSIMSVPDRHLSQACSQLLFHD